MSAAAVSEVRRQFLTDESITATAEAGLLAQDVLRRIQKAGDTSIAFDVLLTLTDRFGVNSAPVASFVRGLLKQ